MRVLFIEQLAWIDRVEVRAHQPGVTLVPRSPRVIDILPFHGNDYVRSKIVNQLSFLTGSAVGTSYW
jgi:hypothetical protein